MSTDCVLFLEKIADMLEAIAQIIPPYQQIYEICKRNGSEAHGQAEDYHLATLFSFVYADPSISDWRIEDTPNEPGHAPFHK